jgi:hypothetical protein
MIVIRVISNIGLLWRSGATFIQPQGAFYCCIFVVEIVDKVNAVTRVGGYNVNRLKGNLLYFP